MLKLLGNHRVENGDLSVLLAALAAGEPVAPWTSGDANGDGLVNGADLSVMLTQFGQYCDYSELAYDYRNQMTKYVSYSGENHADRYEHQYHYDVLGRRMRKITTDVGDSTPDRTTRMVYGGQAGWQLLETERNSGTTNPPLAGSRVNTYAYSGGYIDDPVRMRRDTDGTLPAQIASDYYFHQDDQFNVMALTNASGTIVERYEYGDYGQVFIEQPDGSQSPPNPNTGYIESSVGNLLAFNGREYDSETSLLQYRTRYLNTAVGRFTTRDLKGAWGDARQFGNQNAYVGNSPVSYLDPMGMNSIPSPSCHRVAKRFAWSAPNYIKNFGSNFAFEDAKVRIGFNARICPSCCKKPDIDLSLFGHLRFEAGTPYFDKFGVQFRAGWYGRAGAEGSGTLALKGCGGGSGRLCITVSAEIGAILSIRAKYFLASVTGGGRLGVNGSGQVCLTCQDTGNSFDCDVSVKFCATANARVWASAEAFGRASEWLYQAEWNLGCTRPLPIGRVSF